jgi:hypothetical protein
VIAARLPSLAVVRDVLKSARLTGGKISQPRMPGVICLIEGGRRYVACGVAHRDGTFTYFDTAGIAHREARIPTNILDRMPADEAARLRRKGADSCR